LVTQTSNFILKEVVSKINLRHGKKGVYKSNLNFVSGLFMGHQIQVRAQNFGPFTTLVLQSSG